MKILLIFSPSLLILQEVKLITEGLRPKIKPYKISLSVLHIYIGILHFAMNIRKIKLRALSNKAFISVDLTLYVTIGTPWLLLIIIILIRSLTKRAEKMQLYP
jgi:hypothetical protein